ncbi:MAG: outer membrane protein assembly factor BamD [candidate division Zixibacteria bacterium]|nr:outer membrane protein assembly factor BamD [candidate division Zixibacteria bacterium]
MKSLYLIAGMLIALSLISCGSPRVMTETTAESQFLKAKKEFDKKRYLSASEGFQKVIFNFPGTSVVDTAQYYLAMSHFENEEYELAAVEFNRLITNYPQSAYVDDAQYLVGLCYYKNTPGHYALDQEDLKKAIAALQDFIVENPDSPLIEDAASVISAARTRLAHKEYENGILYFKLDDYKAAEIYFQLVIDDYTDTEYAARALYKLSEICYWQSKYPAALEKFNTFLALYPNHEWVPKAKKYIAQISIKLNTVNASPSSK